MDRNDGLLIGGVTLLAGALQQLEADAIDAARHDVGLRVRRHVRHGRRLARNTSLLVQLAIGGFLLVQGLRTAFRKLAADDTIPEIAMVTDVESVA